MRKGLTLDICSLCLEARLESARGLLRKYPNGHVCSIACWVLVSHTNDTRRIWDHSKKLENRRGRTKRQSHRSTPSSMCALEAPNLAKNHLGIPQLEKLKNQPLYWKCRMFAKYWATVPDCKMQSQTLNFLVTWIVHFLRYLHSPQEFHNKSCCSCCSSYSWKQHSQLFIAQGNLPNHSVALLAASSYAFGLGRQAED